MPTLYAASIKPRLQRPTPTTRRLQSNLPSVTTPLTPVGAYLLSYYLVAQL